MGEKLTRALLAMDAYNRGYDAAITGLPVSGSLGGWTIRTDSSAVLGEQPTSAASFYALAYEKNGQVVISYRGTDDLTNDLIGAYAIGGGSVVESQAKMAVEFYNALVPAGVDPRTSSIALTGHSLGGGLAGLVASLYNRPGTLFDNMAFELAAQHGFEGANAAIPPLLWTSIAQDIYRGHAPWAPSASRLATYFVEGEFLAANRLLQATPQHGLDSHAGGLGAMSGYHSIALLTALIWAEEQGKTEWYPAGNVLWHAFRNATVANAINGLAERVGANSTVEATLGSIIAYSAVEEGDGKPFGDVAIISMFDDATDLGKALANAGVSQTLVASSAALAESLVQFSGKLALGGVTGRGGSPVASGILDLSADGQTLAANFGAAKWSNGADHASIIGRDSLIQKIFASADGQSASKTDTNAALRWYASLYGLDATKPTDLIDRIVFAISDAPLTTTLPARDDFSTRLSLFVAGSGNDSITGSNTNEAIFGGAGNDTLDGEAGNDVLLGGAGNDILAGGAGRDFLAGGAGVDTIDLKLDFQAVGASLSLGAIDSENADARAAFELTINGDVDRAIDVERIALTEYSDTLKVTDLGNVDGDRPMADLVVDFGRAGEGREADDYYHYDDDQIDLSQAARDVTYSVLGVEVATGQRGVRVDLRDASSQTIQHYTNWNRHYWFDSHETSDVLLKTANANSVIGTQYDDVLLGQRGKLGTDEGYSTLRGGGGNDFLAGAGWESHLFGGTGNDTFNLGSSTWVEDASTSDRVTYGIPLFGGVKTWWMEGNIAYWAAFSSITTAFPVIGSELLYTASFFMDQWTMKFARYKLDGDGNLMIDLWGQTAPSVIRDYHLDLDTGLATGGVVVFSSTAYSDAQAAGHSREGFLNYINLALKAGFGVGFGSMDPLVLDLDGDGFELSTEQNGTTYFEFDGDGFAEHTGWIKGGDGFLVRDGNGNGTIDSVAELFGAPGTSGFTALAALDSNGDGKIDASDADFASLEVWRDANMDGISQASELSSLTDLGIASINLSSTTPTTRTMVGDNEIIRLGSFTRADGSTGQIADVALAINESNTRYLGDATVSAAAAALPELTGFGNVRNLRVAMTQDSGLFAMVDAFDKLTTNDLATLKAAAEAILYRWAGVDTVAATPLGTNGFDTRKLAFLEKFSGYQLTPRENGVIALENIEQLEATWANQLQGLTLRLVVQGPLADDFASIHYDIVRDMMIANNATALADLLHTRLEALPEDATAAQAEWEGWAPLLGALSEGMIRSDANEVRADYLFAQLVRAMDGVAQPLSLAQLAEDLGIANVRAGSGANDVLTRGSAEGTAVYFGGGGMDTLTGGGGQDVYVFGRSIGQVTINDNEPNPAGDRIRFAFLNPADVTMARVGNDLLITVKATAETVRIVGQFAPVVPLGSDVLLSSNKGVEDIQFADGSIFEMPEIMAAVGEGTAGVDHMIGTMHTDVFTGRASDDILEGGDDADMYVFNRGDGADTIIDQQTTPLLRGADLIVFGDDIAPEDLVMTRTGANGENLLISVAGNGGSILVQNQFGFTSLGYNGALAPNSRVEMFAFRHYGEAWTNIDVQQRLIASATTAGNDTTRGFGDDDRFAASAGNDLLIGMDGADTYAWGSGAGNDVISEGALYIDVVVGLGGLSLTVRADAVQFSPDISFDSLIFAHPAETTDLVITNTGTGETLTVKNQFAGFQTGVLGAQWFDRIEWFEFADGSRLSWKDVTLITTTGGAGDDDLWGDVLPDTLTGNAGDDALSGLGGGDTYVFGLGDGHDTIRDYNTSLLGDGFVTMDPTPDVLKFDAGISPDDVSFTRHGANVDLVIGNGGGRVTLVGQNDYFHTGVFGALSYDRIEEIRFDNGAVWTWADLNTRIIAGQTTSGNDIAEGFALVDRFEASAGNDILRGADSGDTYMFGFGSGHDRIEESVSNVLYGDDDLVQFGATVLPEDVLVSRDGNDLILTLASTGDTLTVAGQFAYSAWFTWNDIELFRFANGVEWTTTHVQVRLLTPTAGDDHLIGFDSGDVLDGGAGNDILEGSNGGDIYQFGRGSGHDTIRESLTNSNLGDGDRLVFGAGILPEDLAYARDGNDLVITIVDSGDSVRIAGQFNFGNWFAWNDIETFAFENGTTITDIEIAASILGGTPGDDHLVGTFRTDVLDGKQGNDILAGGDGSDIYVFGRGYGQDEIRESLTTANLGEDDELRFGPDITLADLGFTRSGNDLLITILGTTDTLKITGEFNNSSWFSWNDVERFTFADGSGLTRPDIQQILLTGTAGADHLVGFYDANTLDGGAGDDLLEGWDGADTYVFGRGYGHDYVRETKTDGNLSDYDTVQLQEGIGLADVTLKRDGYNLIIELDTGDTLTIESHFAVGYNELLTYNDIDRIRFADGTELSKSDILLTVLQGTPGNDILIGAAQTDILDGGAGDDWLQGEEGSDEYVWGAGYGNDVIQERYDLVTRPEQDRLSIHGVQPSELAVSRSGEDMVLTAPSGETLTVKGQLHPWGWTDIEEIVFDDGTSWSFAKIRAELLRQQATPGDDRIEGFAGDDLLLGGAGDDELHGAEGNDTLVGGTGDDLLYGFIGDDRYRFELGGGHDTVDDYRGGWASGSDTIEFAEGINPDDLAVHRVGDDLVLTVTTSGDSVRIVGGALEVGAVSREIEQIRFADGTIWSSAQLRALGLGATSGNDTLSGSNASETIDALAGNDIVSGRDGNDVLIGNTGNDALYGQAGNDTYVFNLGDGQDVIREYNQSGTDRLVFGAGIVAADIIVSQGNNGSDVILKIAGTADQVTMSSANTIYGNDRVDQVVFADGTTWSFAQLLGRATTGTAGNDTFYGGFESEMISGGAGNDTIRGQNGDDTLGGGTGNDTLYGQAGNDTYVFNLGDGQDIISEYQENGADKLEFGAGIAPADVTVSQADNGKDIVLKINGTTDQITIDNVTTDWNSQIEQVQFVDGTIWSYAYILERSSGGTPGNDTLSGDGSANVISGGAGNDTIRGNNGDDTLSGGTGNDTLYGNAGNDTYVFNLGDGQDVIREYNESGIDKLVFGAGIAPADIIVLQGNSGSDVILKIAGTADQVTMSSANTIYGHDRIDQVVFADGTTWTFAQLLARATTATEGNDTFYGGYESETISGGAGNDTIRGQNGDDTLGGGTGNDTLYGQSGNDTYVFNLGDGQDVIREYNESGIDKLVFGAGIAPTDITFSQGNNGTDVILKIAGTTDQVTMSSANTIYGTDRIDQVVFADGTTWTFAQLLARVTTATDGNDTFYGGYESEMISGGAGNDTIRGQNGDDTLGGGTGNDTLYGNAGNDTYVFNLGDGQDVIREYNESGTDKLVFGAGIAPADIIVSQGNSGADVILKIAGTADQVTMSSANTVYGTDRIDQVVFADGTTWTFAQLLARATTGTGGNDTIYGGYESETISGGAGNDTIRGQLGDDTMDGGGGNDSLYGQLGNDVYVFNLGDGQDTISEYQQGGSDKLVFGAGIASDDIIVSQTSGSSLMLRIAGTADQIEMINVNTGTAADRIDQVVFADGTIWTFNDLFAHSLLGNPANGSYWGTAGADTIAGGDGNDTMLGGSGNDTLRGDGGADTINGEDGDDIIEGGEGNDALVGANGNDAILGGADDDTITGGAGNDTLDGGLGIDKAVFAGTRASYGLTTSAGSIQIVDNAAATDGNDGTDTLVAIDQAKFKDQTISLASPIVLDLDGDGVELTSSDESNARFDFDGDGVRDHTGWTGQGDAFLVYDRNGDGLVSGASEISYVDDKPGARSDLEGLKVYDTNLDGQLSSLDDAFNRFLIWQDDNLDGLADAGEVYRLDDVGVAAIGLSGQATEREWAWGENIVVNTGFFSRTDGSVGSFVDVALNYDGSFSPEYTEANPNFDHGTKENATIWSAGAVELGMAVRDKLPFFDFGERPISHENWLSSDWMTVPISTGCEWH